MAEVAESFDMRPSDVETYYRLGLRARSYILMSMHDLIVGLASRYAAQYRMQQQVRQRPVNQSHPVVVFSTDCCLLNLRPDPTGRMKLDRDTRCLVMRQELVQEGYRAVLKAIDKYDANKGASQKACADLLPHPLVLLTLPLSPSSAALRCLSSRDLGCDVPDVRLPVHRERDGVVGEGRAGPAEHTGHSQRRGRRCRQAYPAAPFFTHSGAATRQDGAGGGR